MNFIPLQAIPNQKFSVTLEGSFYQITFRAIGDGMAADIVRDDVAIISGMRIVAGSLVIPYQYLEKGNFIVINLNDTLIYYTEFQATQFLVYLSVADLATMRGAA